MKQFELFLALEEETCQDLLTTIRPEEETKKSTRKRIFVVAAADE